MIEVLKISAEAQVLATKENIVVCWHGDLETGFFYTDPKFQPVVGGEIVSIDEGGDDD